MGVRNRSLFITKGGGGEDGRVEDFVVSQENLSDPPLRLYSIPKTACPLYFVIDG